MNVCGNDLALSVHLARLDEFEDREQCVSEVACSVYNKIKAGDKVEVDGELWSFDDAISNSEEIDAALLEMLQTEKPERVMQLTQEVVYSLSLKLAERLVK